MELPARSILILKNCTPFQFFSKEHINLLLSAYFFVLGTISLSSVFSNFLEYLLGRFAPNLLNRVSKYHLLFTQDEGEVVNLQFDTKDIASFVACSGIGVWYILQKVGLYLTSVCSKLEPLPIFAALDCQQSFWLCFRNQGY